MMEQRKANAAERAAKGPQEEDYGAARCELLILVLHRFPGVDNVLSLRDAILACLFGLLGSRDLTRYSSLSLA